MRLVTLQFPTANLIWNFRCEIEANFFELNLGNRTITFKCDEQQIRLAMEKYGAKLVADNSEKIS